MVQQLYPSLLLYKEDIYSEKIASALNHIRFRSAQYLQIKYVFGDLALAWKIG
jgi:hypothetical protein